MTEPSRIAFPIDRSRGEVAAGNRARFFVGLRLDGRMKTIQGVVLRILGRGLAADLDVVGTASCADQRIEIALAAMDDPTGHSLDEAGQSANLAEAAADVIHSITTPINPEHGVMMAVGIEGFGQWQVDPIDGPRFQSRCDTALLAKLTGLTVVDDFPSRDRVHGGRGGPLEAAGRWMMLADRGTIPGRRIRALVELDTTLRLTLLPPRPSPQLPPHLQAYDLAPGQTLTDALMRQLVQDEVHDPQGKLAVQGRHRRSLLELWKQEFQHLDVQWSHQGPSADRFVDAFNDWTHAHSVSLHDVLCTAVHLLTDRLAQFIRSGLPRSQPIGQLILSGPGRANSFFVRQIKQELAEIDLTTIDEFGVPADHLDAASIAVLAMLHVDQVPANSPSLTGTDAPRILGRVTPGNPINWHNVLANMAHTLPNKLPLRNAI